MLYSNIQMMRLKKREQRSKLVNVSQGYVCTRFARATTHASIMGPSPSKRKQAGGAVSAMHCGSWRISYFEPERPLSAFSWARMNRFQFFLHIYYTKNYLLHITFISPPVKYPFKCFYNFIFTQVITQYTHI